MEKRIIKSFNEGWKFQRLPRGEGKNLSDIGSADFDDRAWERVDLPHTWNCSDGCSGRTGICEGGENYYRGSGGYRKSCYFSSGECGGRRIFLEFEGANTVARLFVNGKPAGVHEGGFSAFRFDITEYALLDENNLIAVMVSNEPTDYIAPITDQGDFTKMGGIYRNVKLIIADPLHISLEDFGSSGVYVTAKIHEKGSAEAAVRVKLTNSLSENRNVIIKTKITDAEGICRAQAEQPKELQVGADNEAELSLRLENPILWDGRKNPYLYTAEISIWLNGVQTDKVSQSFGIRKHLITEGGFYLNDRRIALHGVNYHQDSFENGWAMTDGQRMRDYSIMLDMGCNAVRMAHYQHCGFEYELCDRLGIAVWTEIGLVNRMSKEEQPPYTIAERMEENLKTQLTELIRQNYNHPSIIVWGISNELFQMSDEIFEIYGRLVSHAEREDGTRPTVYADNQFWGPFLDLPAHGAGCNRYFGWYSEKEKAEDFGEWLDGYHEKMKGKPICVSEYGGGGAISQHKDNVRWSDIVPWGTPHYENFQSLLHESLWRQLKKREYLWGVFIWCMFDFASDGREEGDTKGQNDKGLATRSRELKDAYFFYKSEWNPEPMVHIAEKRFAVRPSRVPAVKVYSNAKQVELFVNKASEGTGRPLYSDIGTVFIWANILLNEGEKSEIKAVAYFGDGRELEDTAYWIGEGE